MRRKTLTIIVFALALVLSLNLLHGCGKKDKSSRLEDVIEDTPDLQANKTTAPPLVTTPPPQVTEDPGAAEPEEPEPTTTPEPTDAPREGRVFTYLLADHLDKNNLGAVTVGIENQTNRKMEVKKPIELQEKVDGAWITLENIEQNFSLDAESNAHQTFNFAGFDMEGRGRVFRMIFPVTLLTSKDEVEAEEQIFTQEFDLSGGKARLEEGEYVRLILDKQSYSQADLALFTIFMENASDKYVMVVRDFKLEILVDGNWEQYPVDLGFSMDDNWFIHPGETDKQSYNLQPYNLDPGIEAYRVVKSYGLFYEADPSGVSDTFIAISDPFQVLP